ncbi:UDP-glycosyltransferase 87A1 [Brachypodium distachyon]|nr:UDP-glycosyltransferase 87A1 [Brachypodium distachyon]|eukprot:XP_003564426.1 UDP-glycosyltransferase 87A1 [Brachypodium distachyon]
MASMATATARHVVAVPFPGRGHINPMLAVCRQLVAAADGALAVTVVVTEEWRGLLASAPLPDRVRFATIPNVIPSEHGRGADHAGFIEAVHAKMAGALDRLLDRLELDLGRTPDAILADTYLTWGVAAGARKGIPVCSLWTQPATFFLALYHSDRWPPLDGRASEEELSIKSLEEYVPGLSSVRLSDIKIFRSWARPMEITEEVFAHARKAHCVLLTSFHELEPSAINRMAESLPCPVYPIGPSVPQHMPLEGSKIHEEEEHRSWLDAQPENSVLYVSFGSFVSMAPAQLEEIAMGIRDSGVRFFWVARDKAPDVRRMCGGGDKGGLAVLWCDQQKVLCHPSVGGFLSHCGWNSLLEAVRAGVPLLAFPVGWDQLVNARIVADEWKVGINLREQRREDGVVSRAAISAAAAKLMDLDRGASQEMRRRAGELRQASRSAVQEGGSSHRSLSNFVQDLMEGRLGAAETSQ